MGKPVRASEIKAAVRKGTIKPAEGRKMLSELGNANRADQTQELRTRQARATEAREMSDNAIASLSMQQARGRGRR